MSSDNVLQGAMRALSLQLRASLDGSESVLDRLSKGELREEDVKRALEPHLPARYEMCSGIVVNGAGEQSDQQDIIIVDTFAGPSLYAAGGRRVVPVETVVGVIQVKSRATSGEIKAAVANLASAKRLLSTAPRYGHSIGGAAEPGHWSTTATFFGGIVCLSRPGTSDETLMEAFARTCQAGPRRERTDALLVVDHFCVVWGQPSKGPGIHLALRSEEAEAPLAFLTKADSVLPFYLCLIEHLSHWITPPIDWVQYAFREPPPDFRYTYWYDEHAEEGPPSWLSAPSPDPDPGLTLD